jgi:hypothetical protein
VFCPAWNVACSSIWKKEWTVAHRTGCH